MIVKEAITAEIAKLAQITPEPAGPHGWGRDLACVLDVTPTLEETDPFSPEGISEAAARRLLTERATNPEDPDYGFNLVNRLNEEITDQWRVDVQASVENELTKDDRVASVDTTFSLTQDRTAVRIVITPTDPDIDPPSLVFAVNAKTNILELTT